MKEFLFLVIGVFLSSCAHTIDFRTNPFFTPVTGDQSWTGNVSLVVSGETKVTVVNDMTTNPPTKSATTINSEIDLSDLLLVGNLGFDANLALLPQLSAYLSNSVTGLRWQFWGNGANHIGWVAALQGGIGNKTESQEQSSNGVVAKASSDIDTTSKGISLGYQFPKVVLYVSHIQDEHKASTSVTNSHGTFGPYSDKGTHQISSVGASSVGTGALVGLEYSLLQINWNQSESIRQYSTGFKVGYSW